jgi:hypothetical protein
MIVITHVFHVPSGLNQLAQVVPLELIDVFNQMRQVAIERGAEIAIAASNNNLERIETITWPSREVLNDFLAYANETHDYDNLYDVMRVYIETVGGTITRTEEER